VAVGDEIRAFEQSADCVSNSDRRARVRRAQEARGAVLFDLAQRVAVGEDDAVRYLVETDRRVAAKREDGIERQIGSSPARAAELIVLADELAEPGR